MNAKIGLVYFRYGQKLKMRCDFLYLKVTVSLYHNTLAKTVVI